MTQLGVAPDPIAIVGIAAQIPSGVTSDRDLDYRSLIDFLLAKGEAYEKIPADRFNVEYMHGPAVGQVITDTGAFLKDIDLFDYLEFGITAKDANIMSLSVRKLIEVTFLSLSDSGIDYRGKNVGCYMAGVINDILAISGDDDVPGIGSVARAPSMIANRVSYHLDLRGPSVPVDTACSSSLYATHLAVQALRNGECEAAVVGGCQINHRLADWIAYSQGNVLTPDGKCKPFDASADGFGRGEGVVVIVLKPLEAAIRDHDHIYATILGTSVNSSGSLVPIHAPAAMAQRDAMVRAFRQAGRRPQDVDYLELHATGTAQGDPTEANWVGAEFKRDDELIVGSLKGNIGHLEISAFLASLCKVCGILESKLIPPNVNLKTPNPAIRWSEYRLRAPLEPEPLQCRAESGRPLIAMTSSGIGGANGHAVVEGPPPSPAPLPLFWSEGVELPTLLVAGALSPRATTALGEALLSASSTGDKAALARIYGRRARSMPWRSFALVSSTNDSTFTPPALAPKTRAPIVFVFSGQGTQHFQMGRDLYRSCSPFRESILELDAIYAAVAGTSLIESTGLFTDAPSGSDILADPWPVAITLSALTMLQLALVDTLAAIGIHPDIVIGHSAGETAVLSASGAASKAASLELAIARGRALSLVEEAHGTMAALSASPEEARKIIEQVETEVGSVVLDIGCYNSPSAVTLSGLESHIDLAVAKANTAGIFARKLKTRAPVHCAELMELCRSDFERLVGEVFSRHEVSVPQVSTFSTVTGRLFDVAFDSKYFWNGTRAPVLFTDAIKAILAEHKTATFVEIGPHPVLAGYLKSMTETRDGITITCPLRRPRTPEPGLEPLHFLTAVGQVVAAGHNCVNFDMLYSTPEQFTGKLPEYPFVPKKLPWFIPTPYITRQQQRRNGPLNYPQLRINVETHPGLADHVIKGEPIMPASGYIEMALEFGANALYDIQFHGLLTLSSERPTPVHVALSGTKWSVSSIAPADYAQTWPIEYNRLHATGYLCRDSISGIRTEPLNLDALRSGMKLMDTSTFYSQLQFFAQYGSMYRRVQRWYMSAGSHGEVEGLAEVRVDGGDIPNFSDYVIHPAILDAALHIAVHPRFTGNHDRAKYHLPSKIGAVKLCTDVRNKPFPSTIYSHATFVSWSPDHMVYDFTITDPHGAPLLVIEELEVTLHGRTPEPVELNRYQLVYRPAGQSITQPEQASPTDQDDPSIRFIQYVRGQEMNIRDEIALHDPLQPLSLVFIAKDGMDGDSAIGFTRSLRREYTVWNIRVVVFASTWTDTQISAAAPNLTSMRSEELEMFVDAEGAVLVPRVEPAPPPPTSVPFDPTLPWKLEGEKRIQSSHPVATSDHVVVSITDIGFRHGAYWEYIGKVDGTSQTVAGITSGPLSSHLLVHEGGLQHLQSDATDGPSTMLPPLIASAIVALSVGTPAFLSPTRLQGQLVLIVDGDMQLRSQLEDICARLGMDVLWCSSLGSLQLEVCYRKRPSFILSGTTSPEDVVTLRSILAPRGRLMLWNDSNEGLSAILAHDPYAIGDTLRAAFESNIRVNSSTRFSALSESISGITETVSLSPYLFDATKSYMLIGGIGSLGLHIALWMYEHGARNVILTSRSGVDGLERRGDYLALRMLAYLQSRNDLALNTVSVDATSSADMVALVGATSRPLGGCMLLSSIYADRVFGAHTEESFDSAFAPKVGAFQALEKAVPIDSLDFCVVFSSAAALVGNAGQTNYAAANNALAGYVRKYRRALAIVAPIVLDSSLLTASEDSYGSRVRHLINWGLTARELCHYIGDGILKVRDHPVWQYIPGLDWSSVQRDMGPSPLYNHLCQDPGPHMESREMDKNASLLQIVCEVLNLPPGDVSVDMPLTAYGLDSLSASSLAVALRPLVAMSQLQLLADVSISQIQKRIEEE
ncbi:ketoacyl-synt-domain-containing protein [Cerioporus squamosus]|nr:ketoacyl-synt-domain-containing protein [Cerioporus squamosus]